MKSVEAALDQINVAAAARAVNVPERTLLSDLARVRESLPHILANRKPGPAPTTVTGPALRQRPERPACPSCGSPLRKNGTYLALNWVALLLAGWLGISRVQIQRWRCPGCAREVASAERRRQREAFLAYWVRARWLAAFGRFQLRLPVRRIRMLVGAVHGRPVSLGFICNVCARVGKQSASWLDRLQSLPQRAARVMFYDETFPKLKRSAHSLGVAMCESGLIRSARCIRRKARDITRQFRDLRRGHYQPQILLTDFDKHYGAYARKAGWKMFHLRDKVHLQRHLFRLTRDAAKKNVPLSVPDGLTPEQVRRQQKLKRKLLFRRLDRHEDKIRRLLNAAKPEHTVDKILSCLEEMLQDRLLVSAPAVRDLIQTQQKFFRAYSSQITLLLEFLPGLGLPQTTNWLESKNSVFKFFSRMFKYFPNPLRCEEFFSGVALMENFEIKERGAHPGTNALQRAGIEGIDAKDFFAAVGLENPQISLLKNTYS